MEKRQRTCAAESMEKRQRACAAESLVNPGCISSSTF
jgi:hypothetical protein